jgi:DNA gyrase subunit A
MVRPEDEVFAITSAGGVIRTAAAEIKQSGRQTMGVRLVNLAAGQSLVAIARNEESLDGANGGLVGEDGGTGDETGIDPGSTGAIAAGSVADEDTGTVDDDDV